MNDMVEADKALEVLQHQLEEGLKDEDSSALFTPVNPQRKKVRVLNIPIIESIVFQHLFVQRLFPEEGFSDLTCFPN